MNSKEKNQLPSKFVDWFLLYSSRKFILILRTHNVSKIIKTWKRTHFSAVTAIVTRSEPSQWCHEPSPSLSWYVYWFWSLASFVCWDIFIYGLPATRDIARNIWQRMEERKRNKRDLIMRCLCRRLIPLPTEKFLNEHVVLLWMMNQFCKNFDILPCVERKLYV